jgi:hypothetical protein
MAQILRGQCRVSTSSVSGGSWPSQKPGTAVHSHSIAPGFTTDEGQSGEWKSAVAVLRVGTWPWIHLSCLLLTKHYDMPSPQNWARFLHVATQLLSLLLWPPARQLPLRLSKVPGNFGKLEWLNCHEEVASDWIIWPGELDCYVMRYLLLIGSSIKGNWSDCDIMRKSLLMDHLARYFLCNKTLLNSQQPEW